MKSLLIAIVTFWISPTHAKEFLETPAGITLTLTSWVVGVWVVFLILRAAWRAISSGEVARKAGDIAAHGAKQVDTFKTAYRDGKDK